MPPALRHPARRRPRRADALLFHGWRALGPLARALPLSSAYALSNALMDAVYAAWPDGRRAMRDNLRTVLGTNDHQLLDHWGQRQLRRYGEYLVDSLRLEALTPQDCLRALEADPDAWPRLRELYGREPIIFALMHFGNWDVGGGAFTAACGRSSVIVESLGNPRMDRAVQQARDGLGMTPVGIDGGILPARRALRHGGTVAVLIDRPLPPAEPGVDLTFCGRSCRLPEGFARLALASGARVFPFAVLRLSSRHFRFRALIDLDFTYPVSGDRGEDVRALTQGVLDVHESWVRRWPDQWYQFRPFFDGPSVAPAPFPRALPKDDDTLVIAADKTGLRK